jgi:hypothetical protein
LRLTCRYLGRAVLNNGVVPEDGRSTPQAGERRFHWWLL